MEGGTQRIKKENEDKACRGQGEIDPVGLFVQMQYLLGIMNVAREYSEYTEVEDEP